jgi:molybdopterin synthase catalytic subunit
MITLKLFGLLKSLVNNQAEVSVPLEGGKNVLDLVGILDKDYPAVAELIHKKKILVSVNQEIAHAGTVIEDFSVDAELARIRETSKRIGGIAIFLGTARDRSKGRDVSGIRFEYYEGMAQKKLHEIRERALKDFDVIEVLIVHRFGDIQVGENIVLVIAAAEHRAEAFRACKWSIDELKQITPIWKQETTPEGEIWVEEHP